MTVKIPRFGLIIGAAKCGTTALFESLARHPEIAECRIKEPQFFAFPDRYAKGMAWYCDLFGWDSSRHRIAVEASPTYTMHTGQQWPTLRMRRTGWSFRFVYLVRNPIERIQAHYMHAAVDPVLALPPLSEGLFPFTVHVSRYYSQLLLYRGEFGRDAILVISQEEMKVDPDGTLRRVFDHFGVARDSTINFANVHSSEYHYRRTLLIRELQARGIATDGITLNNVLEFLSTLDADQRAAIEGRVNAQYMLNEEQCEQIRGDLADDMYLLHADYGIDVAKWGFKT